MVKFILESYSFKRIVILTALTVVFLFILSRIFDYMWNSSSYIPIINLGDVYSPPKEYDNFKKVNLKLLDNKKIVIEGNKKLKLKDHNTGFEYTDTLDINYPDTSFDKINKIIFTFEGSAYPDSIYLVNSKSQEDKLYYHQIFYSSVTIRDLNDLSNEPETFRLDVNKLINNEMINNNDTLINNVLNYFNANIDKLGIAECGKNCTIFKEICEKFEVPCRIVNLQGGNNDLVGYKDNIGYPLHVVCEVFSSKHKKWYVIDPTYGFRFRHRTFQDYLNAVEIANKHTFRREDEIEQDSILLTKRSLVGKDYFKYYENVVFSKQEWKNRLLRKLVNVFYRNFNYYLYLFSNDFPVVKNGFYYVGIKTFLYFFILIIYINAVLLLMMRRLFLVKKPQK